MGISPGHGVEGSLKSSSSQLPARGPGSQGGESPHPGDVLLGSESSAPLEATTLMELLPHPGLPPPGKAASFHLTLRKRAAPAPAPSSHCPTDEQEGEGLSALLLLHLSPDLFLENLTKVR